MSKETEITGLLGEPIGTTSDVYSLGIVLYELLAGQRPYRVPTGGWSSIERIVCEEDPPKPSAVVGDRPQVAERRSTTSAKLARALSGDLDAIVARALRKEPDRRYPSVAALADDLRRHLGGEPVAAASGAWSYRAGRRLRRHRVAFGAAVAVFLSLAAGLAIAARALARANEANAELRVARDEAETEARRSAAIGGYLGGLFSASWREPEGREARVVDLLDPAAERLPETLADDPVVRASIAATLVAAYSELGLVDEATRLVARERDAALVALEPVAPEALALIDASINLMVERESLEPALRAARTTLADRERLLGADDRRTLAARAQVASLLSQLGETSEAWTIFPDVVTRQRRLLGPDHPDTIETERAWSFSLVRHGCAALAVPLLREAWFRQAATGQPVESTVSWLVMALQSVGDWDQVIELDEGLVDELGRRSVPPLARVEAENNLAVAYELSGRLEEALVRYRQLAEVARIELGPEHTMTVLVRSNLVDALIGLGRDAEAEPVLRAVLEAHERALGPGHTLALIDRVRLGGVESRLGRHQQALELCRRSLALIRADEAAGLGPSIPPFVEASCGVVRIAAGDRAAGERQLRAAWESLQGLDVGGLEYQRVLGMMIALEESLGRVEAAERLRDLEVFG